MELERLNARQFEKFRDFIYERSGIRFDERKVTLLSNRIRRRLRTGGFATFDDYFRYLKSAEGDQELIGLLDAVTTNETFFFRTEKHFDWLRTEFLADRIARRRETEGDKTLRIWSAGCANGAEPFSIAICLNENLFRLRGWSVSILGTDISDEMLAAAEEGVFKERTIEAVTEKQRRRYFRKTDDDDRWRVAPELQAMVEFRRHNLLEPLSESAFDCIFIRNVLIYFDHESKQKALANLIGQLEVGGYLLIGPSEGIYDYLGQLKRIAPLVYQKVAPAAQDAKSNPTEGVRS